MKTTFKIEKDVLERARSIATRKGVSLHSVINEALRSGLALLETHSKKPYRTKARDLGLRRGLNLDSVQEVITRIEGEGTR